LQERPLQWFGFERSVDPKLLGTLREEFPKLSHFARHERISHINGKRLHNRWHLALVDNQTVEPGTRVHAQLFDDSTHASEAEGGLKLAV